MDTLSQSQLPLEPWALKKHADHCLRCMRGLPTSLVEMDSSRMVIAFYCLSSLNVLGVLEERSTKKERDEWREWIWAQQTSRSYGTAFRPGPSMAIKSDDSNEVEENAYDPAHIIMTFSALLSLAILHDDFSTLDRRGLLNFLGHVQRHDGSFCTAPGIDQSDMRTTYCVFVICHLLDDWSGIDVPHALDFIARCRTYEGGYGQLPKLEAQGGTTFCAIASLSLCPSAPALSPQERNKTVRWLCDRQVGGFQGRTGKDQDACYSFWCGGALKILDAEHLVNVDANAAFLNTCQFRFGGIAKAPDANPDPFHTYMALAALAMYPPPVPSSPSPNSVSQPQTSYTPAFPPNLELDVALNATRDTADWARRHISGKEKGSI